MRRAATAAAQGSRPGTPTSVASAVAASGDDSDTADSTSPSQRSESDTPTRREVQGDGIAARQKRRSGKGWCRKRTPRWGDVLVLAVLTALAWSYLGDEEPPPLAPPPAHVAAAADGEAGSPNGAGWDAAGSGSTAAEDDGNSTAHERAGSQPAAAMRHGGFEEQFAGGGGGASGVRTPQSSPVAAADDVALPDDAMLRALEGPSEGDDAPSATTAAAATVRQRAHRPPPVRNRRAAVGDADDFAKATLASLVPNPQAMDWRHERCEPSSAVGSAAAKPGASFDPVSRDAKVRWGKMRGVKPDCAFTAVGSFAAPLDAAKLRVHAAALQEAVTGVSAAAKDHDIHGRRPRRQPKPTRLCSMAQLRDPAALQFLARPRMAPKARGDHDAELAANATIDLVGAKLRHAQCELPDPDRPYEWLVLLTAAARAAGQAHASVALVGDSVHRNLMAALIAVMRGQRETVVDRQAHVPVRYVLMERGDVWEAFPQIGDQFGKPPQGVHTALGEVLLEITYGPSFGQKSDIPTSIVPSASSGYLHRATTIVGGGLMHIEGCGGWRVSIGSHLVRYAELVMGYMAGEMRPAQTYILRGSSASLPKGKPNGIPSTHNWKDALYRTVARVGLERLQTRHSSSVAETTKRRRREAQMDPDLAALRKREAELANRSSSSAARRGVSSSILTPPSKGRSYHISGAAPVDANGVPVPAPPPPDEGEGLWSGDAAAAVFGGVFFLDSIEMHEHGFDAMQPTHRQLRPVDNVHYTCVAHYAVPRAFGRWPWDWWQCRSYHDKAHASLIVAMTAARLVPKE